MSRSIEDIRNYMIRWNRLHPVDYWWREKHNIAFLSKEHKEASFIDQLLEFEEHLFYKEKRKEKEKEEKVNYIPNIGEMFKEREIKPNEIDEYSIEEFRKEADRIRAKENGRQED